MSVSRETTVWCDIENCAEFIQYQGTIAAARQEAVSQRWRRINGKDVCNKHYQYSKEHIRRYFKKVAKGAFQVTQDAASRATEEQR